MTHKIKRQSKLTFAVFFIFAPPILPQTLLIEMLWKMCNRITYLNQLIKQRATGTPKELAQRLGITERAWYKLRDKLVNDLNVPIDYCPHRRSYIYTEEGSFEIGFRRLKDKETENISGGRLVSNLYTKIFASLNF